MKSSVVRRSIDISGHKTSISLEDAFWQGLKDIAQAQGVTLSTLVGEIDRSRQQSNLSSAIRVFVYERMRARTPHISVQSLQPVPSTRAPNQGDARSDRDSAATPSSDPVVRQRGSRKLEDSAIC